MVGGRMNKRIKVAILGGSGYTAGELLRLLRHHPHAEVVAVTSRAGEKDAPRLADLHPRLRGQVDLKCEAFDPDRLVAKGVQLAFSCLPHGASMEAIAPLLARGLRVIDLSADYRLRDANVYAHWYKESHADLANLARSVYGLPEVYREELAEAQLVANPGCYPQAAVLSLLPLAASRSIQMNSIVIDAKSGVSGAGRTPSPGTHFPECNESVAAYGVGTHRHTPEIEQTLADVAEAEVQVIFTPHLIPMDRGIFSTTYVEPTRSLTDAQVLDLFREYYRGSPFIRVTESLPATKHTAFTNYCDLAVRVVRGRLVILAALDNLVRGASGVAVQNFNLMHGLPEITGLLP